MGRAPAPDEGPSALPADVVRYLICSRDRYLQVLDTYADDSPHGPESARNQQATGRPPTSAPAPPAGPSRRRTATTRNDPLWASAGLYREGEVE